MGQFNSMLFPSPECQYDKKTFDNIYDQSNDQIQMKLKFFPSNIIINKKQSMFSDNYEEQKQGHQVPFLEIIYNEDLKNTDTLLFFHGNGEDIYYSSLFLSRLSNYLNLNILAIEYPGYGIYKELTSSAEQITIDAEYFYNFSIKNYSEKIIIFGRSMGSGPACHLAQKYSQKNPLILMSAYTSIKDVAKSMVGGLSCLVQNRFENIEKVKTMQCPVFLIHGKEDKLIPYSHSQKLFENLKNSQIKDYHFPNNMTHNQFELEDDIFEPIKKFLDNLKKQGTNKKKIY